MKKLNKKVMLLGLLITGFSMNANELGLEAVASRFWNEVKASAKYIIAVIFLVSVLFNIGKVIGNDRDYKGFFIGVALFFGALTLLGGVITYILSLNF